MSADKDTKRKMAVAAMESYNLNLLARDEDFNVRTLALCNKAISPAILDQAVEDAGSDDKFTLMVIANNPSASSSTLSRIFDLAGDERCTTRDSEEFLISAGVSRKKRKKVIDQQAAVRILQYYLDSINKGA